MYLIPLAPPIPPVFSPVPDVLAAIADVFAPVANILETIAAATDVTAIANVFETVWRKPRPMPRAARPLCRNRGRPRHQNRECRGHSKQSHGVPLLQALLEIGPRGPKEVTLGGPWRYQPSAFARFMIVRRDRKRDMSSIG